MLEPHGAAMPIAESPRSHAASQRCGANVSGATMVERAAAPRGKRNGAYRTGRYTAEAKAERRQFRRLIRELRYLIDSAE
jgi:hypothetical protein